MAEQRLMEEVLEGMRELRGQQRETSVKVAEVLVQLKQMKGVHEHVGEALRRLELNSARIATLESKCATYDGYETRLKKVENTAFRVVAVVLMLVGGLELLGKLLTVLRAFGR